MIKKLQIASLIMLIMVLVVSCAPKPTAPVAPSVAEEPVEAPLAELPTTEASVDGVAEDISDSVDVDEELDTSKLDDVDDILAEIENI